ncbi:MAG: hypothetical protein ACRD9S_05120 [Pyrinomonadaceae bacterium]
MRTIPFLLRDYRGHLKFLIFYLVCGIAATLAQLASSAGSNVPNLGAYCSSSAGLDR